MKRAMATAMVAAMTLTSVARADAPAGRTIFKCRSAEGLVFSDRPCGPSSEPYQPDLGSVSVVDSVVAPATSVTSRPAPAARQSSRPVPSRAQTCARLDESLHRIAATMRSGYGVKQGERLKERKREIEARRRAEKC